MASRHLATLTLALGLGCVSAVPAALAQQSSSDPAPADPAAGQSTLPPVPADGDGERPAVAPGAAPGAVDEGGAETAGSGTDRSQPQATQAVGDDWPYYGGGPKAQRYSPLDQINTGNVGNLERAFVYRTGDMPSERAKGKYAWEGTPLKVGRSLYMCSAENILISVDAATGKENWRYDPKVSDDAIPYSASCRGVAYYVNPQAGDDAACKTRIIEGTLDARLIAVDAKTGEPCEDFGDNGAVSLWDGIGNKVPGWYAVTAPPAIVRGVIVTGAQVKDGEAEDAPSGVIRGYDAVTGKLAWAWDLANPELTGEPADGQTYTRGTPNMWTAPVGDEKLGLVYLPLGNSSVDYYGGNRSDAENEWATSLVALDVTTGKPAWHFQTVHYDLWDYDLGSQPTLVDFPTDKGKVPAVILPSKQGDLYILDRRTGESLFPVKSVDAPSGGVEPENLSPTQPTSAYHTLRKKRLTEKDMWGATPLDQLWCRIQFRRANYDGFFTPPSADKPWIQYPGYNGGSDWGSVSVDPKNGILIANYNDVPNYNRLIARKKADEMGLKPINERAKEDNGSIPAKAEGAGDPQAGAPYAIDVNAGWRSSLTGMPCTEPPYGGITAIDLASGETLWDEPLGEALRNGPFGIASRLPLTIGTPNNGGPLTTAGGLVFVAAATDDLIRAIDVKTGKVVWQDQLPAGGQATPMTYEVDGRQYLAISAGGHHFMETPVGDYLVVYALPQNAS